MTQSAMFRNVFGPIHREYTCALDGLRDVIKACPGAEWTQGETGSRMPVRQAAHCLFAVETYLGGHKRKMGQRFGCRCENFRSKVPAGRYPPRREVLKNLQEVRPIARAFIEEAVRTTLTDKALRHPPLSRAIYVLRHTVVHLAYLRRELFLRGIDLPAY